MRQTTDNLEAYDDFLRGLEYRQKGSEDGNVKARQMFEKAVQLDPKYAQAYAILGQSYLFAWIFQWSHDPLTLDRAFQQEQQVIALDDSLSAPHSILAAICVQKSLYDQAVIEPERSIALNPNSRCRPN